MRLKCCLKNVAHFVYTHTYLYSIKISIIYNYVYGDHMSTPIFPNATAQLSSLAAQIFWNFDVNKTKFTSNINHDVKLSV